MGEWWSELWASKVLVLVVVIEMNISSVKQRTIESVCNNVFNWIQLRANLYLMDDYCYNSYLGRIHLDLNCNIIKTWFWYLSFLSIFCMFAYPVPSLLLTFRWIFQWSEWDMLWFRYHCQHFPLAFLSSSSICCQRYVFYFITSKLENRKLKVLHM